MRRHFFLISRKIDDCCDSFFESFGINCRNYDFTKYYPWNIMLLIVAFYISASYLIWYYYMPMNWFTVTYYLMACLFMVFCIISLYKATMTDPGTMEKQYTLQNLISLPNFSEEKVRVCEICGTIKTLRTHHCSKCKKCVINLDHHCIWTNNCVGYKNRKFFNLLLFYGSVALIMAGFSGVSRFSLMYEEIKVENIPFSTLLRLYTTVLTSLSCIGNGAFLFKFFMDHFLNVLKDETTFERKFKKQFKKPNKGKWRNFKQVFGENILTVFIPFGEVRTLEYEEITLEFDNDFVDIEMRSAP